MSDDIKQYHTGNASSICLTCLGGADGATAANSDQDVGAPTEGDYAVCYYCGTIGRYNHNMSIAPATDEDMKLLREDNPQGFDQIRKVSFYIKLKNQEL